MSLASIYKERARADQEAACEVNAGVYHAWAIMWQVRCDARDRQVTLFNPKTNLSNAPSSEAVLGMLFNLANCNEVLRTRIRLCELPCELMHYRPDWRVLAVDGGKLCERCDHNMLHQFRDFKALPLDRQDELRKAWERLWPECRVDARGLMVLR